MEYFIYVGELLGLTLGVMVVCGLIAWLARSAFMYLVGNSAKWVLYASSVVGTPVHELGHALMCIPFGHRITDIKLLQFPNMNIKILTYNICHGMDYTDAKRPDFKRDWLNINLDKTAKVVENSGADIVGLNEIYNSGDGLLEKQPKVIADKAGYGYHAFGLALSSSANREYGNALISKYKILAFVI